MDNKVDQSSETRQRLIEAAGQVFAEHGFHATTIREISRLAGANVAAVNYHFGDKMELYAAVLRYAHTCAQAVQPTVDLSNATPDQRLHAFITAMLHRLFDAGRPSWHSKLMSREMIEPTEALRLIVEEGIRPQTRMLQAIIADIIGPADEVTMARCQSSVVGQIVFYHHARPVLEILSPHNRNISEQIEPLAEHITRFALGGLKEIAAHLHEGSPR
jgi:AcrR family transcriptional regulator